MVSLTLLLSQLVSARHNRLKRQTGGEGIEAGVSAFAENSLAHSIKFLDLTDKENLNLRVSKNHPYYVNIDQYFI